MKNLKTSKLLKNKLLNVPAAKWRRPNSAKNVAKANQRTNVCPDPLMFDPPPLLFLLLLLLLLLDHGLSSQYISANYSRWIVNRFWTRRDSASYNARHTKGRLQFKNLRIFCSWRGELDAPWRLAERSSNVFAVVSLDY